MNEFVKRLEQAVLSFKYAGEDFRKNECIVALLPYAAYPLALRDIHAYIGASSYHSLFPTANLDGETQSGTSLTIMGVACHCIRADVRSEMISKSKLAPSEVKATTGTANQVSLDA